MWLERLKGLRSHSCGRLLLNPLTLFAYSFIGGNWAMGGKLLKKDEWVQHGLELSESAW